MDFLTGPEGEGGGPRLAARLTPNNVERWLCTASRYGLDGPARICIDFCVSRRVQVPGAALTALQPAHAEELLSGMVTQLAGLGSKVRELAHFQDDCTTLAAQLASCRADLSDANSKLRRAATSQGRSCSHCRYDTFTKPNGKYARFCINCGAGL